MIDKLIGLTTIGSTLAGFAMLQRFLSGVVLVIALTVISALMFGFLMMGGVVSAYFTMIHYGVEPMLAALMSTGFVCLLTALVIGLTVAKIRQLQEMPQRGSTYRDIPALDHIGSVVSAFIKGLKASSMR